MPKGSAGKGMDGWMVSASMREWVVCLIKTSSDTLDYIDEHVIEIRQTNAVLARAYCFIL